MTIVDRYLALLFLRTFLICFLSFSGLFVVVHLFSNLDELAAISETIGWSGVMSQFYLPRMAELFDKSAAILTLVAALFSVSLLQRRNELTAIEAGGLTKARILRWVTILSVGLLGLTVANREMLIPKLKDQLVWTPQSWGADGVVDMKLHSDPATGVTIRGDQLLIAEGKITKVEVDLPYAVARTLPKVTAGWAIVKPADQYHPEGLWLHQVDDADRLEAIGTLQASGQTVVYSPVDQSWLRPGQCFIPGHFDIQEMAYGDLARHYDSTAELIRSAKRPRRWGQGGAQVALHARMLKPALDLSLLMLGLPLVLGGRQRNVFVAAGIGFWLIVGVHLTSTVCQTLGTSSLIRPAALAAWLPLMVFGPWAVVAQRRLRE